MKRNLLLIASFVFAFSFAKATKFTVITSGFTYSPSTVNAELGDTVVISASASHPLVQISQASWNANSGAALAGGWGTKTSQYTHIISVVGDIYYGCANHIGTSGMKGKILVTNPTGIKAFDVEKPMLNLAPNPAKNFTNVMYNVSDVTAKTNVTVFDITGKVVLNPAVSKENMIGINSLTVNTANLSTGLYFVQLSLNNEVYTKKLFVE